MKKRILSCLLATLMLMTIVMPTGMMAETVEEAPMLEEVAAPMEAAVEE